MSENDDEISTLNIEREEANKILSSFIGETDLENIESYDITQNSNSIIMADDTIKERLGIEDKIEEEIIFLHYFQKVRRLEFPNKSNNLEASSFYDYEDEIDDYSELCNTEVLQRIKEEQILNILRAKIDKYLTYKNINFNCIFMRNLYSYAEEVGFENTMGFLLPLIMELKYNTDINESIYAAFFDGLENLLAFFKNYDKDKKILFNKILPIIKNVLYTKKDIFLLNKAIEQLKLIMQNITKEEIYKNILPMLIEIANNEKNEFGQEMSIEIFNDTAHLYDKEIIEYCVLPHFQAFSMDDNENIRRCCISNMIHICENINYSAFESKLIVIYSKYAQDPSKMNRKICCDLIPSLCKISKSDLISNYILKVYLKLINDKEIFVKTQCLSIFGEFISYLQIEDIKSHPELFDFFFVHFLFLYENIHKTNSNDKIPIIKCAFSFPCILMTYYQKLNSLENWKKLKIIYEKLIIDNNDKIKKTIAHSFAEVSKILGYKISETELSPIILNMYKKSDIKIKETIIDILPDYIMSINDFDIKLEYLNIIKINFIEAKKSNKWRNKIGIIKFTGKTIGAYNNDILFIEIFNFCIQMCFDKFSIVRIKAAKTLSKLLHYFLTAKIQSSDDTAYKENCIKILGIFASCVHYHYRQLFVYMSKRIIMDENLINSNIINLLENISYDDVANVKITLGNLLYKIWIKSEKNEKYSFFKKNNKILEIMYRLKNDLDRDVRKTIQNIDSKYFVQNIQNFSSENILKKKNVNSEFNDNCEEIKNIFGFSPPLLGTSSIIDKIHKKKKK